MGSSYAVTVFQREIWTGKFQHWSKTTEWFMIASIIHSHMNLVAQIWIYLQLPLVIYPAHKKDPSIPPICSQLPYLLPLEDLSVLWPPLMINQISFLIMILVISVLWRNMWLSLVGWKGDTAVGNMIKKYATKKQGYIAPHALIRARNFMIVMVFPGLIQRQVFYSWKINIICHNFSFDSCVFLPSIF